MFKPSDSRARVLPTGVIQALKEWFKEHGAQFPWRGEVGWYGVLVAEFVLVRTRRSVAERAFREIVEKCPDPVTLCESGPVAIEPVFRKIGLPARARRLWETVCRILRSHGGEVPCDYRELLRLPGVGDYIARVLLARVCRLHYAFADANVVRVLTRLLGTEVNVQTAVSILERSVEPGSLVEVNTAILDIADYFCKPKNPRCLDCPLSRYCSTSTGKI